MAMEAIAQRPAEEMVSYAERQRFNRLGNSAKSGAERLVCFASRRIADIRAASP